MSFKLALSCASDITSVIEKATQLLTALQHSVTLCLLLANASQGRF